MRPQPVEPAVAAAKIASPAAAAPQQVAHPTPAAEPKAKAPEPKAKAPEAKAPEAKAKAPEPNKGKGKKGKNKQRAKANAAEAEKPRTSSGRPAVAPRSVEAPQASAPRGRRALVYIAAAAIAAVATYAIASRPAPESEPVAVTDETAASGPEEAVAAPEAPAAAPEPPEQPQQPKPLEQPAATVAAAPPQPEPIPTPVAAPAPAPAPAPNYVLEIVTRPEGARVSIGDQRVVTPGELQLGALAEPVVVKAEKDGYLSAAATIDRVGFMLDEGSMRRRVVFNLSEAEDAASEPPKKTKRDKPAATEGKPKSAESALAAVSHSEPKALPADAPNPEPKAAKQTPMQAAMTCLGNGDNGCVVSALEGKAKSAQELELLIETHRAMGHPDKVEQHMQVYVTKFPTERRAATYKRVLDRRAGPEAP